MDWNKVAETRSQSLMKVNEFEWNGKNLENVQKFFFKGHLRGSEPISLESQILKAQIERETRNDSLQGQCFQYFL